MTASFTKTTCSEAWVSVVDCSPVQRKQCPQHNRTVKKNKNKNKKKNKKEVPLSAKLYVILFDSQTT